MAIGTTGVNVSLDETSGLQNLTATPTPPGDADDNDILVASLPSTFATRLTALGAGTATGAALSGYTGAVGNTGSNAFTVTTDPGASITNISFVDSNGAPLNGLDSGLDTLDGTSILLYTDANNDNIVLGRAGGSTGAIVFAAYIEETGSPVSGGKIWTVEYQPLKHPDATNADDSLNLLNKVFVGTSQDLEFSLAGVPSGANLFLMFTKANPATETVDGVVRITDPTIIATGKDPADQSSGANINTGDTIITSQAANPTTFGTNNQMITEQDGIRFSFVTGARQDVTIPNLSQTEANFESNIDFTGVFNARMANFDVVQLQSGKSAVVKISAFTTLAEPGVNFINGYAGDTSIAITNVRVFNSAGVVIENSNGSVNDPAIGITFSGGVATITGVLAGYQIEYTTASDHNRVLVENGAALDARGNNHADFDIGGFTLVQASVSKAEIGSKMIFEDDGPSADVVDGGGAVTIDETAGNQDNDSDLAAVLALFDTEVTNKGTDLNPTEFAISTTPLATTTLSSFGQDAAGGTKVLSLAIVGGDGTDSLLNTTDGKDIKLFKEGNLIVGRYDVANGTVTADDPAAFAIALQQDGNVAVAQYVSLTHPVAGSSAADHDDRVDLAGLVNAVVTVTDGDGDISTDSVGIGDDINFDDDGPSADVADGGGSVTIDETAGNQDNDSDAAAVLALFDTEVLNKGTDLNPTEFAISTTPLATTALSSFGQDQEGATKVLSLAIVGGDGTDSLLNTTDGKDIKLFKEGNLIIGRYDVANGTVTGADPAAFAVALLQDGNVAVAQYVSLTHPIAGSSAAAHDDQINLAGLINAVVTVTDGDGDTSTDSVGIGGDINFDDDGPTVSANSTVLLDDDALTGGNPGGTDDDVNAANASGTLGHDFGQDGAGTVAYLTSGAPTGFTYVADGTSLLVKQGTTTVLTLTMVAATGAYSVVQNNPIAHAAGLNENNQAFTISYRVTDGDGDTADGTLGINVDDDTPVIETAPVQDVDPTLGATSWTFSGDFAYSIGADKRGPTYSSAADSDFAELALSGSANDVAIVDPTVTWDSENLDAATFDVSFKYDHDRNAATDPELVEGTLVFDKVNDTYTFEMDALQTTQDVTLGEGTGYETYDVDGTSPSSGPSPVATGKLGEGFFIQITGFESPLSAGGNTVVTAGELVSGTQAPVTLSSTALGVSGNTIQAGEAANINFFQTDPKGDLGADNFSYATDFFIKFDGYETESDDLLLIVSLADANDPSITTTRAIYVDQGDVYENDTVNTDLVGTKYEALIVNDPADPNDPFLDNNDALLIVESNDFNIQTGDNWLIKGIQILSNDAGLTGSAINLNRNVGADGASSTSAQPVSGLVGPGNTIAEDTSTNPLKIIDAGFSTTTTTPATLDLTLDFKVVDSDSDFTAVQTIDIENPVVVELVGVTNLAPTDLVL
ncbi:beta strand repeat-containing protein [Pseudomonas frederiksbergensis]|uniref:beta strand repeat-containing protein n=1 Tax=Pseudomonas frederiksbergensis TaxID=104087 RepID=UPI003D201E92